MKHLSRRNLILVGIGLIIVLFMGSYLLSSRNSNDQSDSEIIHIRQQPHSYIRDLNQNLSLNPPNRQPDKSTSKFDISFKQLACRNLIEYLGDESIASSREQLADYAAKFESLKTDISQQLPQTSRPIWDNKLSVDILNQSEDIYGNFRLLANYATYLEQEPKLNIFNPQDLDYIKRSQIIAYALYYADSPNKQPRPDIAYGLPNQNSEEPALNKAVKAQIIGENLDRYKICDLTYIYTNASGEGLSSHDFGDVCRSGSLPRPTEFAFILPSQPEMAYINPTVNHPDSWPIGYESLTEDCSGSYLDRNQTHERTVQFLVPIETDPATISIDVLGQNVPLN